MREDGELLAGCGFHISALQPPAPNKHNGPMDKRLIINFQKGREGGRRREEQNGRCQPWGCAVPSRGAELCALGTSAPECCIPEHPQGCASTSGASGQGKRGGNGDGDEDRGGEEDGMETGMETRVEIGLCLLLHRGSRTGGRCRGKGPLASPWLSPG